MISTLKQYILDEQPAQQYSTLKLANQQLKLRSLNLESKIQQIGSNDYLSKSKKTDFLENVIDILALSDLDVEEEIKLLGKQQQQVDIMISYVQKYIGNETSNDPRVIETKIKALVNIVDKAQQNKSSTAVIGKMKEWNKKLIQKLQKKLCQLVNAFQNHIRIKVKDIEYYGDLLNEEICKEFIISLYKQVLVYDVPTFSYVLLVPGDETEEENGDIYIPREKVIFTLEQSKQIYKILERSIKQIQDLTVKLFTFFEKNPKLLESLIKQNKKSQQDLKVQIQYILPYLEIENRKNLLQTLSAQTQTSTDLWDILVRLRIKGQDGDMMEANVAMLVDKLKGNNNESQGNEDNIQQFLVFMQICESEEKSLNMGFYVCNQLVNRLEGYIKYSYIQKILNLREEMRFRIHHPS